MPWTPAARVPKARAVALHARDEGAGVAGGVALSVANTTIVGALPVGGPAEPGRDSSRVKSRALSAAPQVKFYGKPTFLVGF